MNWPSFRLRWATGITLGLKSPDRIQAPRLYLLMLTWLGAEHVLWLLLIFLQVMKLRQMLHRLMAMAEANRAKMEDTRGLDTTRMKKWFRKRKTNIYKQTFWIIIMVFAVLKFWQKKIYSNPSFVKKKGIVKRKFDRKKRTILFLSFQGSSVYLITICDKKNFYFIF